LWSLGFLLDRVLFVCYIAYEFRGVIKGNPVSFAHTIVIDFLGFDNSIRLLPLFRNWMKGIEQGYEADKREKSYFSEQPLRETTSSVDESLRSSNEPKQLGVRRHLRN
jgi:hypothetical protein